MANQVQIKTSVNVDKIAEGSIESRLVKFHDRITSSKSAAILELCLGGMLLREMGLCQQLVDYASSKEWSEMTVHQQRQALVDLLTGGSPKREADEPQSSLEPHKPPAKLGSWGGLGG